MKIFKWTSLMVVISLLASCYPEKDRTVSDFDIVVTNFSDTVNFDNYNTYMLADSLIVIYDSTEDKPEYPVDEAAAVMSSIRKNMMDYGWVEVTGTDTPDVYIEPTTWNSTISGVVYYPGYGYPGYGYPGYGWGYPGYGYGGGASYYQYTTGTVMMYMMDVKYYAFDDTPPAVLWRGGLNGLLTSGSTISRIEFSINQAFSQSSYLKK